MELKFSNSEEAQKLFGSIKLNELSNSDLSFVLAQSEAIYDSLKDNGADNLRLIFWHNYQKMAREFLEQRKLKFYRLKLGGGNVLGLVVKNGYEPEAIRDFEEKVLHHCSDEDLEKILNSALADIQDSKFFLNAISAEMRRRL